MPLARIAYDETGRALCHRCNATALAAQADDTQIAHGARRFCRRCQKASIVRMAAFESNMNQERVAVQAPGLRIEHRPGSARQDMVAFGFRLRCLQCRRSGFLLAFAGVVAGLFFIGMGVFFALKGADETTKLVGLGMAGVAVAILLADAAMRLFMPARKTAAG